MPKRDGVQELMMATTLKARPALLYQAWLLLTVLGIPILLLCRQRAGTHPAAPLGHGQLVPLLSNGVRSPPHPPPQVFSWPSLSVRLAGGNEK